VLGENSPENSPSVSVRGRSRGANVICRLFGKTWPLQTLNHNALLRNDFVDSFQQIMCYKLARLHID
jgi:hypothetical protein